MQSAEGACTNVGGSIGIMKLILMFSILLYAQVLFGQSPEQIALNFYAIKILNQPTDDQFLSYHDKKIKVRYDKHINPIDSQYQELCKLITSQHNDCKIDPRGINNSEVKRTFEEWKNIRERIDTTTFEVPEPTNAEELQIPEGIKYKKNLKFKKLRGGFLKFYADKIWYLFFREKFNLTIEPHCKFDTHKYVWLKVSKDDLEYGDYYFIEITNKKVTDWCQISWIQ